MKKISCHKCLAIFRVIDGIVFCDDTLSDREIVEVIRTVVDSESDKSAGRILRDAGWYRPVLCAKAIRGIAAVSIEKNKYGDLMRTILKLNREWE